MTVSSVRMCGKEKVTRAIIMLENWWHSKKALEYFLYNSFDQNICSVGETTIIRQVL